MLRGFSEMAGFFQKKHFVCQVVSVFFIAFYSSL